MNQLHEIAVRDFLGMPVWVWALIVFLGALNEAIERSKSTTASTILQGATRALLKVPALGFVLARFPLLGDVLRLAAKIDKPEASQPSGASLRVLLPFVALAALSGCQAVLDGAQRAKGSIAQTLRETGQAWEKYDGEKMRQINVEEKYREDAARRIAEYSQGERAKAIKAFNGAHQALEAIDKILATAGAAKAKEVQAAIANAYAALSNVIDFLTSVGVKIPAGVL